MDRNKGLDHIMISENSELTVDAFKQILTMLEADEEGSTPTMDKKGVAKKQEPKTKVEIVQQLNSRKIKPYIH